MNFINIFAKLLKILLSADSEIQPTTAQRIKDALLYMLLGMALLIGIIYFMDDDPSEQEPEPIEVIEENRA